MDYKKRYIQRVTPIFGKHLSLVVDYNNESCARYNVGREYLARMVGGEYLGCSRPQYTRQFWFDCPNGPNVDELSALYSNDDVRLNFWKPVLVIDNVHTGDEAIHKLISI